MSWKPFLLSELIEESTIRFLNLLEQIAVLEEHEPFPIRLNGSEHSTAARIASHITALYVESV